MGALTMEDFRDEVRLAAGGIPATSTVWTDARVDRRINDSYRWVCMPNHFRHPELEVTEEIELLVDTATYIPTNTFYMFVAVAHAEGVPGAVTAATRRTKLDPDDVKGQLGGTRSLGKPAIYAYWNEEIIIQCLPAAAYVGQTLEVFGYIQPLALGDGDSTVIKTEWDEVITIGALWRMHIALGEHDQALEAKENYGTLVNEIADIRKLHGEEWGWTPGNTAYPGVMGA